MTFGLPLDQIALAGYTFVFVFSLYKLSDTVKRPVDLVANVLLLLGVGSLITYHYRKLREKKDETNDSAQKNIRAIAHSSIVGFFLLTFSPMSAAVFRFYDYFALVAHMILFITVLSGQSQLLGVGLLALYFGFGLQRKIGMEGMEILNTSGRALLFAFFVMAFILGVKDMMKM